MVNGVLYTVTPLGLIAALDPATGQTRWVYDPKSYKAGRPNNGGFMHARPCLLDRRHGRAHAPRHHRCLSALGRRARPGKPDPAFGNGGQGGSHAGHPRRDARHQLHRPPAARRRRLIVVGSSISDRTTDKGSCRRATCRPSTCARAGCSGRSTPCPRPGEFGYRHLARRIRRSTPATRTCGPAWRYDPELDYVYLPTSTPTNDYYGGHRPGNNLSPKAWSASRRRPASACGTFRRSTTASGTTTSRPIRCSATSPSTAAASRRSCRSASRASPTRSIGKTRRAGLADRGAAGAAVDACRASGTSPTQPFPTQAAAVRSAGQPRREPDRLHARAEGGRVEQLQHFDHGPLFTPPSEKGDARAARIARRRELGRRGVRSGDRHPLRAVADDLDRAARMLPGDPTAGATSRYRSGGLGDRSRAANLTRSTAAALQAALRAASPRST